MMEQLRNRQSVVASGEEGRAPTTWGPRATSLIFYFILFAVVVYVVFYVQDRVRFFRTSGIVATAVIPVASSIDGRVTEVLRSAGESVKVGDHLITVEPGVDCAPADTTRLVNMALDVRLAQARRQIVATRIASREARAEELGARRGLELGREFAAERDRLSREIEELQTEYSLLGTEIGVRQRALAESSGTIVSSDTRCHPELVYSPTNGTVHELLQEPFSVVDAGTAVISLTATRPDVRVVAQLDGDLLKNVFRGKEVRVLFPDGSEDLGVVDDIRGAADVVDMLDLGSYSLPESEVVMVLTPRDSLNAAIWLAHDRLLVEVRGRRGRR